MYDDDLDGLFDGLFDDLGAHGAAAPDDDDPPPLITSVHLLWCIRTEAALERAGDRPTLFDGVRLRVLLSHCYGCGGDLTPTERASRRLCPECVAAQPWRRN